MNKRNFKRTIVGAIILFLLVPFFSAFAGEKEEKGEVKNNSNIQVEAKSAILLEPTTGEVIYEKNSNEKFAPASVTKVMTMLIAMEHIDSGKIKIDDKVTCSENAKKMGGSTMLLDNGEIRTMEELLKGVAIASGNDAAVAIAEYIGGSQEAFVEMMNEKAKSLGMENTHFQNCSGLPAKDHYSTAKDIGLMSLELLKHKDILKYSSTYMETITEGRKTPIELVNHNKLVRFFKGCDGLKTGYTAEAKYCISATATRNGVRMLTVIMGAPTYKIRNRDAGLLLNHGFSKFEGKKIVAKDEVIGDTNMSKESDEMFSAKAKQDLIAVLPKGFKDANIEKKIVLDSEKDEFKAGEIVGKCELYNGKVKVGEVEIYTDRDITKPGIFAKLKYKVKMIFTKEKTKDGKEEEINKPKEKTKENKKDTKENKKDEKESKCKDTGDKKHKDTKDEKHKDKNKETCD